jgi:hypothetical protein
LSPQTIGVEPLKPGSGSFHATFSCALHLSGRLRSSLVPFNCAPRHCGQLEAVALATNRMIMISMKAGMKLWRRIFFLLTLKQHHFSLR